MSAGPLSKTALCRGLGIALCFLVTAIGCDPEIPQRTPGPERVEAIFNPDTGEIPLPNDAAMEDGRLPGLPGAAEGTAEAELSDYLSQRRGWPRTTAIEVPFNGPLDEQSIDEVTVRLYRIDDQALQRAQIDAIDYRERADQSRSTIEIIPARPPEPGAEFAVAVTNRIAGANGVRISAAPPIYFAASTQPLIDDEGEPTLELFADEPDTARSLEQLRLLLKPLFDSIEAGVGDDDPIDRDDLATLFRWTWMPDTTLAFHPGLAQLPLPNTAALDDDGTFPDQAVCHADEDSAQGEFERYLTGLSGWPVETPLSIDITGPVEVGSIDDDDIQVFRDRGQGWERIEPLSISYRDSDTDPCTGEVTSAHILDIELGEAMETHEDYFAFATRAIGPDDDPLVPEAPMLLAIQPHPLIDDDGNSLVSTLDDDSARTLQQLRDATASARNFVTDELGIHHSELAGLWGWHTWDDAFAVFDPERAIPLPNSALIDDEDDRVDIPIPEDADTVTTDLLEALNRRTGFSVTAPGWIPIDGELDPDSIDFDTFKMLNLGTISFLEDDEISVHYDHDKSRLIFEPIVPMPVRNIHVGALTDQARGANGRPVQPTPAFVFLRGEHPVYENGQSTVTQLDDQTAQALEEARETFQFLFALAEPSIDAARSELATAWGFLTEDPTRPLREIRARIEYILTQRQTIAAHRHCDVEGTCGAAGDDPHLHLVDDHFEDPNQPGLMVEMTNVRALYSGGEFNAIDVDMVTEEVSDGGERIGISVYLPESNQSAGTCVAPYDVAIVQHGFGTDRWHSGLALANELAAHPHCLATVAMDFPDHGGRTSAATPHPDATPQASGQAFLSSDLPGSKQNFVQSIADLFTLVQLIDGDGQGGLEGLFEEFGGTERRFGQARAYLGTGLGGITGVPFAALEPSIGTAALNSAGGRLAWLIEGDDHGPSQIGDPIVEHLAQQADIHRGDAEFDDAMAYIQWLVDRIDPFAFAPVAIADEESTLIYDAASDEFEEGEAIPRTEFLLQMADDDRVIVNRGTESLAHALGVSLDDTTFESVPHGFLHVVDPDDEGFGAADCARRQAAAWLNSGLEGTAELPAELSAAECVNN